MLWGAGGCTRAGRGRAAGLERKLACDRASPQGAGGGGGQISADVGQALTPVRSGMGPTGPQRVALRCAVGAEGAPGGSIRARSGNRWYGADPVSASPLTCVITVLGPSPNAWVAPLSTLRRWQNRRCHTAAVGCSTRKGSYPTLSPARPHGIDRTNQSARHPAGQ